MNLRVLSFDGLHRSGKGRQLGLLESYFQSEGTPYLLLRGDGSRKGDGGLHDPLSDRWQQLQPLLRSENDLALDTRVWRLASDYLNEELAEAYAVTLPQMLAGEGKETGIILLDRSVISKYFREWRDDPSTCLDDVLRYQDSQGYSRPVIVPDLAFVMHATKQTLLTRNENKADHQDKYLFRKRNIEQHHGSFESSMKTLKAPFKMVHLDAEKEPETLFEDVIRHYEELRDAHEQIHSRCQYSFVRRERTLPAW